MEGNREEPSDILFLENKHFQRPWWVFPLNKANFAGEGEGGLFLPVTAMFQWLLWFGLEQCIQKANRKDGQLSWLEEQFRKRGLTDIPRSFILQSFALDSEQSPSIERHSLFWVGYVLCECLSIDWSECKEDKYLFLPVVSVPVLNDESFSVVCDYAETDVSELLLVQAEGEVNGFVGSWPILPKSFLLGWKEI